MSTNDKAKTDPTLHLPRILCLHGGGTNARIFRMQCRMLERHFRSSFRLVYAEAPFIISKPGPDVTSVYKNYAPFKAWLRTSYEDPQFEAQEYIDRIEGSLTAAICIDDLLGATGEWVGILGFSQGAKIAASVLYSQQMYRRGLASDPIIWPDFKFGVLMAGRGPLVWLDSDLKFMPDGLVDAAALSIDNYLPPVAAGSTDHVLQTPTVHVHGLKDPSIELHRTLLNRFCDPESSSLMEWQGDHRIPIKTEDVLVILDQIMCLGRKAGVLSAVDDDSDSDGDGFWPGVASQRSFGVVTSA